MGTYSKFISKIEIEPNIFEIKNQIFYNGACQCFKDCDCHKRKNTPLFIDIRYSYGAVNEFGKERTFNSLEGCKQSYNAYLLKQIKNENI